MTARRARAAGTFSLLLLAVPWRIEASDLALTPRWPSPAHLSCMPLHEGVARFGDSDVDVIAAGPARRPGPLIVYWHGTDGDSRRDVRAVLGDGAIAAIRENGGLIVAPVVTTNKGADTSGNGVWHEGDFDVLDALVACADAQGQLDAMRIHSLGMSAGGLHTAALGYARSEYLASLATLSGGHVAFRGIDATARPASEPRNKFAAMVVHGGVADRYGLDFEETSAIYARALRTTGHHVLLCNHDQGHTVPAIPGFPVWRFFRDHPFGVENAYGTRLPQSLERICRG